MEMSLVGGDISCASFLIWFFFFFFFKIFFFIKSNVAVQLVVDMT